MQSTIAVSGPDAESFLNGQLTQSASAMKPGDCRPSLLLQPNGRVVSVLELCRTDDGFEIIVLGDGLSTLERLKTFLFRVDCVVELTSTNDDETTQLNNEIARISKGIPGPAEWGESVLPHETGMVEQCVDFSKGCYVGQELVARVDSRGRTTKRLAGLIAAVEFVAGDTVVKGDIELGDVSSVVSVGEKWIGIGYLKNAGEAGDEAQIGSAKAVISGFPLLDWSGDSAYPSVSGSSGANGMRS